MHFARPNGESQKLRLAIAGPSGSGKTVSSLLIAYGLCGDWDKIGLLIRKISEICMPIPISGTIKLENTTS